MVQEQSEAKLGFLASLTKLFRSEKTSEADAAADREPAGFDSLRQGFESALRELDEKAEACRRQAAAGATATVASGASAEMRAQDRAKRLDAIRLAIRQDVGALHEKLGTGLGGELESLSGWIEELAGQAEAGKGSRELLPRIAFVVAEKLRREAGELAVARLVALLEAAKLPWPDPTRHRPSAEPEEVERSRRRRLGEVRESFANQSLLRTAECMLGVVKAWGIDYPERGTPLWEETVLEGVAAGLRGALVRDAVELLRRDREALLARTEDAIGKELATLQQVIASGVRSLEQANQAASASLRVIDEVVPEIAWQHVRGEIPRARGEWGG